jgi:anti-anti-sigma regulatory factor
VGPAENCAGDMSGNRLVLPSLLDITAAELLCRLLIDCLSTVSSIVIEGADVARVSTAAIQVLLAAAGDATSRGISFRLNEPSEALSCALADLGLAL